MTPGLFLGNAVLSLLLMACSRAGVPMRTRLVRAIASAGVVMGSVIFLFRDALMDWRGLSITAGDAAIAGVAIACAWALVLALDLGEDRWWAGGLVGVAATGLLFFAAGQWTVPALLFLACASLAICVAVERAGRAAWLASAAADGALVTVLVTDALLRDSWATPLAIEGSLLAPLLAGTALRAGLVLRLGPLGVLGTPAAALGPVSVAVALVSVSRWVEPPLPIPAAVLLVLGLGIAAWAVLRRSLDPAVVGVWPVALAGAMMLASERAGVPAAVSGILGLTVVMLWPDSLERGRLSRGLVLSGLIPTVAFGALAITARSSFVAATGEGGSIEIAAWLVVSALLPAAFATGVALGIFAARAEVSGGYHPEAVFTTWVLLGASVVSGGLLGTREVYGAVGGGPAMILFVVAGALGALAAVRNRGGPAPEIASSARVSVSVAPALGRWAAGAALLLHVASVAGITWLAYRGLQVGFL